MRVINGVAIQGAKFVKQTGLFDGWTLNASPTSGNNVAIVIEANGNAHEAVNWSFVGENASDLAGYVTFADAVKSLVNVGKLFDNQEYTLQVEVTLLDGTVLNDTKKVCFYNRIPMVGDFAYLDGDFDNEYYANKSLAGMVFKKDPMMENGVVTGYKLWVVGKEDLTSRAWGVYLEAAGNNGFPNDVINEMSEVAGLPNAANTSMPDLGQTGIKNAAATSTNYGYIDDSGQYLDASQSDGYAVLAEGSANDFDTEGKNAIVIDHANKLINKYLGESLPTTLAELNQAMTDLIAAKAAAGDTKTERWRQLYYPATYQCYLYEPTVSDGETLHDEYKKHKWLLPACGHLGRIYNFYHNSRGRKTNQSISATYANEDPTSEALLPLFANMLKRIADAGGAIHFNQLQNGNHWSVTEYNQISAWFINFSNGYVTSNLKSTFYVVRPVVAFNFHL